MKNIFIKRVGIGAIMCIGIFTILIPSFAAAANIQVLSSYQHIEGSYYGWNQSVDTYEESDGFFEESTVPTTLWDYTQGSLFGGASASSRLNLSMGVLEGWVHSDESWDWWDVGCSESSALAELDVIFTADSPSKWRWEVEGGFFPDPDDIEFYLDDATPGIERTNLLDLWDFPINYDVMSIFFRGSIDLTLLPNHVYRIYMSSSSGPYSENHWEGSSVTFSASQVPEPTTMLLLGLGLMGLVGLKRKIQ